MGISSRVSVSDKTKFICRGTIALGYISGGCLTTRGFVLWFLGRLSKGHFDPMNDQYFDNLSGVLSYRYRRFFT